MAVRPAYPTSERNANFYSRTAVPRLQPALTPKQARNFARGLSWLSQKGQRVTGKWYDYLYPINHRTRKNRKKGDVHAVVIHTTEGWGPPAQTFSKPDRKASSHYSVERDGSVVYMVAEKDVAWHAGTSVNDWSVGIEVVGFSVDKGKSAYKIEPIGFPVWQIDSLAKLTAGILKRWGLKPSRLTVFGHAHVGGCSSPGSGGKVTPYKPNLRGRGGGKSCHYDPGDNFPWEKFMALVKKHYYGGGSENNYFRWGLVGLLGFGLLVFGSDESQ